MTRAWDPNPAYEAGIELLGAGEASAALEKLTEALAIQPERARIHSNLARALADLGREEEARAAAERGRQLADDGDPYPLIVLADTLCGLGADEEAVAAADGALACPGSAPADRVRARVIKSWALIMLQREREAIALARSALELEAGDAAAWDVLAAALGRSERWGEALRAIEQALELAPEDERVLARKAGITRGLADAEAALATARADCAATPEDWERWVALGSWLTMTGRLEEAAASFDRAHQLDPDPHDHGADGPHPLSPWEVDCRLALQHPPPVPLARRNAR